MKLKGTGCDYRIEASSEAFYPEVGIFWRMNPCGYGLDQTIRAVDVQKLLRPQFNCKDKSGMFGLKDCNDFLVPVSNNYGDEIYVTLTSWKWCGFFSCYLQQQA